MSDFAKKRRLLTRADYDFVFAKTKKLVTRDFVIFYRENLFDYPRIGFALSKKKIAKAHDRNRIKRLVRESFRKTILPAIDIVMIAGMNVKKETNAAIAEGLVAAWKKLGTLASN